jgi:HD superfamily phosphodiesterase
MEEALCQRVRADESSLERRPSDSLWGHLERVAKIAEQIGTREGLDRRSCRLVGLFHDAGKFAAGGNRADDRAEEVRSVEVLRQLAGHLAPEQLEPVAEAILMLYRGDPDPSVLARVLFDADNLEKLGPLGVANFFVKQGLRGGGISERALRRLTIELTYARVAPEVMMTATGRELARTRAAQTSQQIHDLLDTLRADGVMDLRIDEVEFEGLVLEIVEPQRCPCGGELHRKIWEEPGMKCAEIHLEHRCERCDDIQELRFCRPRLPGK